MKNQDFQKYSNKRSYNNQAVQSGYYLVPFLVHDWNEVKAMNYCRENLENWHFNGVKVLVAFAPVSESQFPSMMKLFWKDVREYISDLGINPDILSYDKMLEDISSEDANGYDPAQFESLEETILLKIMIEDLISEVERLNPRYGRILRLIQADKSRSEILNIIQDEFALKKTQGYSEISAAQKLARHLFYD